MSEDTKKTRTETPKPEQGKSGAPAGLGDIYDPQVLAQVTAEIEAEEKKEEPHSGWVVLPTLPPPPESDSTTKILRLLKRLIVLVAILYLALWGVKSLLHKVTPHKPDFGKRGAVPLPSTDLRASQTDGKLTESLEEGRRKLASSDLKAGVLDLIKLAEEHPDTRQGQKAMRTLAATFRFQLKMQDEAIQWYRKAIAADPDGRETPSTMVRLADYLDSLGRQAEAKQVFQDVLTRFPDKKPYSEVARAAIARMK